MSRFLGWFGLAAVVALAYFLAGALGGLLALPPGPALTVWPAAGVALAALLWGGRRLWPGIYLGAFGLALWLPYREGNFTSLSLGLAGVAAVGPVLQALAGTWFLRQLLSRPMTLLRQGDIWLFVLAAGPLPGLIGATWDAGADSLAAGSWTNFPFEWLVAWIANAFGAVLVLVLLLPLVGQPPEVWRPRRLTVCLPMLVLTALGTVILVVARSSEREQIATLLDSEAKLAVTDLHGWTRNAGLGLTSWRNHVAAHFEDSPEQLEQASIPLLNYHDTLRGVGILRVVDEAQRAAFEAQLPVRDRTGDQSFAPAPPRRRYACLTQLYPAGAALLGWDLGAAESSRAALERACDTNEPSAAGFESFLPGSTPANSLVVFLPVYAGSRPPATVAERRQRLRGYVLGVYNMDVIISKAMLRQQTRGIRIRWDMLPPEVEAAPSLHWLPTGVEQSLPTRLAGRSCAVHFLGTEQFLRGRQTRHVWLIAVLGCAFNVLLGVTLLTASGRTALVEAEVRQRTAELTREVEEHRRTEEALRRAKEVAETANRAKTDFLSNVSHELRTPLNGILGMTELLLGEVREAAHGEQLRLVKRSGESLLAIINDLLDFSRIEAGRVELDPQPFHLHQEVGDTLQGLAERASAKGLKLVCEFAPDVPDAVIGDAGRFRQVLVNLVGNAIKFTEQGGVTVRLQREPAPDGMLRLGCSVTDTGIGIPLSKLDAIFEPFEQADRSTTRRFGGTGLGLTIAAQLVELLGGKISVESELGEGSTFCFSALFRLDEARRAVEKQAPPPPKREEPADRPSLRVLVAEDNPVNQKLLTIMLEREGHSVQLADNGTEVLTALEGSAFDLVLMDVQMPQLDGWQTTAEIRRRWGEAGKRLPIVALTAMAAAVDREKCLQAGMDDYLRKPIQIAELSRVLGWVCQSKAERQTNELSRVRCADQSHAAT